MGHRPLQKLLNNFARNSNEIERKNHQYRIMEKQTENLRHHKNYNFAKREKQ